MNGKIGTPPPYPAGRVILGNNWAEIGRRAKQGQFSSWHIASSEAPHYFGHGESLLLVSEGDRFGPGAASTAPGRFHLCGL